MNTMFFLLFCIMMTATPGPTNIMILSTVHNYGVKKALEFSFGATLAFFLLLSFSLVFNSLILIYLPKLIIVLQIMGACYMLYLAYCIFKENKKSKSLNNFSSFKTGFLMQFINPKAVLFSLSVFPSFILPYYTSYLSLSFFLAIITLIACVSFLSWVLFGKVLKSFLNKYNNIVNNIMAFFLVIFALTIIIM